MARIRVCVIGGGRVATIHLKVLLQLGNYFTVTSVVDDSPSLPVIEIVDRFPDMSIKGQKFVDDAIADCDAVLIATPTFLHAEYIVKALSHGKHVLCEKPIVTKIEEVEHIYGLARDKGLKLLCGMTRRFDEPARKIKEQVKLGNLGRIMKICCVNRDHPYPNLEFLKNSPILYYDNGIHDVDMCIWLTEEKPSEVFCVGTSFDPQIAEIGDDDNGAVIMKFPSGAIALLDLARVSTFGFDMQINVHGQKKSVFSKTLPEDGYVEGTPNGIVSMKGPFAFYNRYEKAFVNLWKHFYESIVENVDVSVTEEEVMQVTLTLDAIDLSRKIGLPVSLDHIKRKFHPKC